MSKLLTGITAGIIAAARTTEELWFRTNMDVCEIAAWAAVAYIAGIAITYAVDEFRQKGEGRYAETHRATAAEHSTRRRAEVQ